MATISLPHKTLPTTISSMPVKVQPSQNEINVRRRIRKAVRNVQRLSRLLVKVGNAPSLEHIIDVTCALANLDQSEVIGPSRKRSLADARKAIIGVAYSWGYNWTQIGKALGGRHRTTIMTAHLAYSDLVVSDSKMRDLVCRVTNQLVKS